MKVGPGSVFRLGAKPACLQHSKTKETSEISLKRMKIGHRIFKPFRLNYSSKGALVWHLRPIRKGQNDRILIIFLSCFHRKLDFDQVSLI